MRILSITSCTGVLTILLFFSSCESKVLDRENSVGNDELAVFPDFITPVDAYFDTRIDGIPEINEKTYRLAVTGAIDRPATYSMSDLGRLNLVKKTLTIECIGNVVNGSLIGTAEWRGFRVYDLLEDLGIQEGAATVKYKSADGYFTFNTLEELRNKEVLGALFMNDESIPPKFGYPLRILFPGYFGVRQPGWIVEMEVLKTGPEDFWSGSGWKSDSAMSIDSRIFFPKTNTSFSPGDSIRVGGAAFGARRISRVEVTLDEGNTWMEADLRQSLDEDYVWVFWELTVVPAQAGILTLRSRATAQDGRVQPESDMDNSDGLNAWPSVKINVSEGG